MPHLVDFRGQLVLHSHSSSLSVCYHSHCRPQSLPYLQCHRHWAALHSLLLCPWVLGRLARCLAAPGWRPPPQTWPRGPAHCSGIDDANDVRKILDCVRSLIYRNADPAQLFPASMCLTRKHQDLLCWPTLALKILTPQKRKGKDDQESSQPKGNGSQHC